MEFPKKLFKKIFLVVIAALVLVCACVFTSCAGETARYVTSIEKTSSSGAEDIHTVTYSDGETSTFTVRNGADGKDVSVLEIYQEYKNATGDDLTFAQFLEKYLTLNANGTAAVVGTCLQSSMKVYSEYIKTETDVFFGFSTSDTAVSTGSAVIYAIDDGADGYTTILTNYHVVYIKEADSEKNGGTKIARKIYGYLYGSENTPSAKDENGDGVADKDSDGYTIYSYGDYAIALEYVGGSAEADIAVLRAKTSALKAINEDIRAVTLADAYHVGETAIAIGNPEGKGLSVTQGIVSTENEQITLNVDGTARAYRSLRIDTPLYSGNSGGGLFNANGEVIGITNAGNSTDQNINYAIPLEIVRGVAENILFYDSDGNADTNGAYKLTLGITVSTRNSKYVYDPEKGYGNIQEEIIVQSVSENSVASRLGLAAGDKIVSIEIAGTNHPITRSFHISDVLLTVRANDALRIVYERDGEQASAQTIPAFSDFSKMD